MELNKLYKIHANIYMFSIKLQTNICLDKEIIVKVINIYATTVVCVVQEEYFNPLNLNLFMFYIPKTQPSYKDNEKIGKLLIKSNLLEQYL